MATHTTIRVEPITAAGYAPFGWVFGEQPPAPRRDWVDSDGAGFWHEHDFLVGDGGDVEFVWVTYKARPAIATQMEAHRLTEQAIVPVTGQPLLHIVAPPNEDPLAEDIAPDVSAARAFYMDGTKGVCMKVGTWHMHFALGDNRHFMVTRRSTTNDILGGIRDGRQMQETVIVSIEPIVLDASHLGIQTPTA